MADEKEKIGTGPNDRPIIETIAGTGPGIPDDSLAPGEEELPRAPTPEEEERIRRRLGASEEVDTLPLDGE
jgi:hypothetical protein